MRRVNFDIDELIWKFRIRKWEVAAVLGIADATLSRWLRYELSSERKAMIQEAIKKLSNGRSA